MKAGIDYSMSCPAITVGDGLSYSRCKTFFLTSDKKNEIVFNNQIFGILNHDYKTQQERFDLISDWAIAVLKNFKVDEVVLEGYAFAAKGSVFDIGENTGLLKHKMWKAGIEFIVVPPPTVKKYFTGKGNANKIEMYEAFLKKASLDISSLLKKPADGNPISDIVDSYAMFSYGVENKFFK